jgi:plasmid stabilization system protein ParE
VWEYYERVASAEVADKLLREINEAAGRLVENALIWKARDDVMPGLRSVLVQPYAIFYRVNDGWWRSLASCTGGETLRQLFRRKSADGRTRRHDTHCSSAIWLERVKGIEPSSSAWKAVALPLSYTRACGREQGSVVRTRRPCWPLTPDL